MFQINNTKDIFLFYFQCFNQCFYSSKATKKLELQKLFQMFYPILESPTNLRYQQSLNESLNSPGNSVYMHIRHPSLDASKQQTLTQPNKIIQKSRVNSQRKLTITTQNNPNFTMNFAKQAHQGLKRQGKCVIQKKGKFNSLKTSQIYQQNHQNQQNQYINTRHVAPIPPSKSNTDSWIQMFANLKKQTQQKMQRFMHETNKMVYEQGVRIKQLQNQIIRNNQQLYAKNKKIEELLQNRKYNGIPQTPKKSENIAYISKKVDDLQRKTGVLLTFAQSSQTKELNAKIDYLKYKVTNLIGFRLIQLKNKMNEFLTNGEEKLDYFQKNIAYISLKSIKKIECLREEICIMGSKISQMEDTCTKDTIDNSYWQKLSDVSVLNQNGVSFSDDYFFHPEQKEQRLFRRQEDSFVSEEDSKLGVIAEMLRGRREPLRVYVDKLGFIRYKDSDAYLFDKRGNILTLSRDELNKMVNQNLLVLA